jgi:hypothetical protein
MSQAEPALDRANPPLVPAALTPAALTPAALTRAALAATRRELIVAVNNPFATRWVRPGAIDFEFPPHDSLAAVIERWERRGRRGAIVGPHGSGKSTLLAALVGRLAADGIAVRVIALGERGDVAPNDAVMGAAQVVALDGYERLGRWRGWRWRRYCRRRGLGLLITSHRPTWLATLFETRPTVELAERVAARLLAVDPAGRPDAECLAPRVSPFTALLRTAPPSDTPRHAAAPLDEDYRARLRQSFAAHRGDVRETLFDLYDFYEARRGSSARPRTSSTVGPGIGP